MTEESIKSRLSQFQPIAGAALSALALFSQGSPLWVKEAAVAISFLLILAWLLSETGWLSKAIKYRWFRSKLSKGQALRLGVQLDEINSHMSTSYTLSPFCVWHSYSNKYHNLIKMNYDYHGAIQTWLVDLNEKIKNPGVNNLVLLDSLAKALSEASKLARLTEGELESLMRNETIDEQEKRRMAKEWDAARSHFNQWINSWSGLFKEINKSMGVNCAHHFQPLGIIS